MRTLLVVAALVAATLPLGKAYQASSAVAAHGVTIVDGGGPDEPIPGPPFPKRA